MYILFVGKQQTVYEKFPNSQQVSAMAILFDTEHRRWYRIEQLNRRKRQWSGYSPTRLKEHHLAAALLI